MVPLPAIRVRLGVAFQGFARSEQAKANRPSGGAQMTRDDETVTSVIAGPAEHCDLARRPFVGDQFCDGLTGRLHQIERWNASLNGQSVRLAHLRDGQ